MVWFHCSYVWLDVSLHWKYLRCERSEGALVVVSEGSLPSCERSAAIPAVSAFLLDEAVTPCALPCLQLVLRISQEAGLVPDKRQSHSLLNSGTEDRLQGFNRINYNIISFVHSHQILRHGHRHAFRRCAVGAD